MIEKQSFAMQEELIQIRRALHKIPEDGFLECKTSAFIQNKLKEFGIPYQVMAQTGVVGLIAGDHPGKTVLLRADMDALPIQEESGESFASEHPGFMHACGHDVHVTCLLGAAKILNQMKSALHGNIKLVFQPAEEGDGGAQPMIEAGVLENPRVDAAFAMHVEPLAEVGTLQFKNGSIMASPDNFEFTIYGKGGHGALPHKCVNPITIAAAIIQNIQAFVDRELSKSKQAAVSVCSMHTGTCYNVIPDTAVVQGTARSLDPATRRFLAEKLEKIATETAKSMGAECDFRFIPLFPPLVNDSAMTTFAAESAQTLDCVNDIVWLPDASMTGDDFAYFVENIPGSYFKLGVGNQIAGICEPLHSAKFRIDENALQIGTAVLAKIAFDYLNS